MVDFSKINSFDASGSRGSFEELISILAKREKPKNAVKFWPVEGSGGDGGVDAVWLLNNGEKVGYQAKYFLSLNASRWSQINESVKQALKQHPELKRYVLAIPCNLTEKNEQRWKEKVEEWTNCAERKDIEIEFEVWTKTDLNEKLAVNENASLVQLWFGETVLNDSWFQEQVKTTANVLGDRYSPCKHVQVPIESVFDAVARGPEIQKQIANIFSEIKSARIPNNDTTESEDSLEAEFRPLQNTVTEATDEVIAQQSCFTDDISQPWDITSVKASLEKFEEANYKLSEKMEQADQRSIKSYAYAKLLLSHQNLHSFLQGEHLSAETSQCALIYGPAGAGKSHVFGHIAEQRTKQGLPTMLLLGQDFANANLWDQIGAALRLEKRTAETVLGTLNASGERIKKRALLLIDAINEGAGANYWRGKISWLIEELKKYPNIGVVFSCREEYVSYAIPKDRKDSLPQFFFDGFSTVEKMEQAAEKYLDGKRIISPNSLWHSSEFFNPLFLKSVCEAMKAKGETELPLGIHGISELIALYLDTIRYQPPLIDYYPKQLESSIKKLVQKLAMKMADDRCDFVTLDDAHKITQKCFEGIQLPPGKSWLQIILETSLLRLDPPPYSENREPLDSSSELVRFTFQRFQEYLIARSLISTISLDQIYSAFEKEGPLNFLFHDGIIENGINHRFLGLINILSTIYPEKCKTEFVTTIPNWEYVWEREHVLQSAFSESCKSRQKDAFTDETLKIFNRLDNNEINHVKVLLEVSMMIDHPWNAHFLHKNLKKYKLPERDCIWTRQIDSFYENKRSNIERIISWASSCLDRETDPQHLELASLVLAWFLSSSNRPLRDKSTKALATIFLKRHEIFHFLLERISDCDDPYIIERFYAAAFGACCNDPNPERLKSYSNKVYEIVFAQGNPPVALLTRDYALGILEFAEHHQVLDDDIDMDLCRPPYHSAEPDLELTEIKVKELIGQPDDEPILYSSSRRKGSFSSILTPKSLDSFLTARLSSEKPGPSQEKRIDTELCDLWVAKRMHELGWNMNLFPHDGIYSKPYRALRQIGTKYQCIALDELQARLADNFWMAHWHEAPDMYQYSSFHAERDIDPTILQELPRFQMEDRNADNWIFQPAIKLPEVTEEDLKEWPFQEDPAKAIEKKLTRTDSDGKKWIVLHEYYFEQESYKKEKLGRMDYDPRLSESRAFYCIFMKPDEVERYINFLREKGEDLDINRFAPRSFYDGPYLLEAPWRDTWKSYSLSEPPSGTPVVRFHWGSDVDHSIPKGFEVYMPQQWFARELGLNISLEDPQVWKDENGVCVIQTARSTNSRRALVIDEDRLKRYANKSGMIPIWVIIAERRSHLGGLYSGKGIYSSRKALGAAWLEGNDLKQEHWLVEVKRDGR